VKLPAPLNPADANKIVLYTGSDYRGPVLLHSSTPEDGTHFIEFFSGRTDEVTLNQIGEAAIIDQVMFMSDRNDYVQITKAQRAEERQLDNENQDLGRGDAVLVLPTSVMSEIKAAVDLWADNLLRPDRLLPLLLDRRKLWLAEGVSATVERPARDLGLHFRVRRTGDDRPMWVDWHAVRCKPLKRKAGKTRPVACQRSEERAP